MRVATLLSIAALSAQIVALPTLTWTKRAGITTGGGQPINVGGETGITTKPDGSTSIGGANGINIAPSGTTAATNGTATEAKKPKGTGNGAAGLASLLGALQGAGTKNGTATAANAPKTSASGVEGLVALIGAAQSAGAAGAQEGNETAAAPVVGEGAVKGNETVPAANEGAAPREGGNAAEPQAVVLGEGKEAAEKATGGIPVEGENIVVSQKGETAIIEGEGLVVGEKKAEAAAPAEGKGEAEAGAKITVGRVPVEGENVTVKNEEGKTIIEGGGLVVGGKAEE